MLSIPPLAASLGSSTAGTPSDTNDPYGQRLWNFCSSRSDSLFLIRPAPWVDSDCTGRIRHVTSPSVILYLYFCMGSLV